MGYVLRCLYHFTIHLYEVLEQLNPLTRKLPFKSQAVCLVRGQEPVDKLDNVLDDEFDRPFLNASLLVYQHHIVFIKPIRVRQPHQLLFVTAMLWGEREKPRRHNLLSDMTNMGGASRPEAETAKIAVIWLL